MEAKTSKTPAGAATSTGATEKLAKGNSATNTTRPPAAKKRRKLPIHLIVREEKDHLVALCGHRVPRRHAVAPHDGTTKSSKYDYFACHACETLNLLEREMHGTADHFGIPVGG